MGEISILLRNYSKIYKEEFVLAMHFQNNNNIRKIYI